ncbi:MAG: class I SAM-dependent methyltransferase [bacterium]|nr:class I SAM-dependent methyltransferase [bacterium]
MYESFVPQRLKEGNIIAQFYEKNIHNNPELTQRALGANKNSKMDFNFFEGLFHKVAFSPKSMSILDIYCGRGYVFEYAQYKHFKIGRYVGLDIVKEFVDHCQNKFPKREIQHINFIDPKFQPDQHFDIVT